MFPKSKLPPITRIILYTNIAVHLFILFIIMPSDSQGAVRNFYEEYGLIPSSFMDGAFWQPVTSMFMHGYQGSMLLLHITFNMIGVVSIGIFLEKAMGALRFSFLYMVSGIMGGLAVVFLSPDLAAPTVGASGALSGLLAATAVLMPNARVLLFFFLPMKVRTLAVGFFLISLYYGLQDDGGFISHWGHLGGLVGGFLYTVLSNAKQEMSKRVRVDVNPNTQNQSPQNDILRKMEEMLRQTQRPSPRPGSQGDYGKRYDRQEKEINPQYDSEESEANPADKKIIFDPKTGRYIIK